MSFLQRTPLSLLRKCFRVKYFSIAFVLLVVLFLFQAAQPPDWWQLSTKGLVTSFPELHKNLIILSTNQGTVTAVDRRSGKVKWEFDREKEVISQPFIQRGHIYVGYRDGMILALNPDTGKVVWQHEVPNDSLFDTGIMYSGKSLIYGDTNGTVHAISLWSGKELWSRPTPQPDTVDQLLTPNGVIWFGSLLVENDTTYVVRTHGYVAALSTRNGELKWEKKLSGIVNGYPLLTRTTLSVSTSESPLTVFQRRTGELKSPEKIGTSADIFCQFLATDRGPLTEASQKVALDLPLSVFAQEDQLGQHIIQVDKKGKVVSYNRSSLEQEWEIDLEYEPKKCFFDYERSAYLSSAEGKLTKIDLRAREVAWEKTFPSKLVLIDSVKKFQSLDGTWNTRYYTDYLFVSDEREHLYRIDPRSGDERWTFKADGTVSIPPLVQGNQLFMSSSNGGVYRLEATTGKPHQFTLFQPRITWKANTDTVRSGQIFELSLFSTSDRFLNPYTGVDLRAEFRDEKGTTIPISGFFYDHDEWRVRFNPPTQGKWTWTVTWTDPYRTEKLEGNFESARDHQFLRTATDSAKWLVKDGQTIHSLVGLNDCFIDRNGDGSPLNDFFTGEGSLKVATISGEVPRTLSFNSKYVTLPEYLDAYKDSFNLFRQGVGSCAPPLYVPEEFMTSHFLVKEGKEHDTVSKALYERGYSSWFTMFGFSLPFGEVITYPDEKFALQNYVKYVVARFGAYVDIWEIGNEAVVGDEYVRTVAQYIQQNDPFDRLISMSWEKPHVDELTLTAPHWYQTEKDQQSDLATLDQLYRFRDDEKPIIFGEQGNEKSNWDPTSAKRMRTRIWTAFFNQSSLVFWNESSAKNYYNAVFKNSNLYIGDEERQYTAAFLELTSGLPTNLQPQLADLNSPVHMFTLSNDTLAVKYYFNTQNPSKTTVSLPNPFSRKVTVQWFSTETGEELKAEQLEVGAISTSPTFEHDLFARVTSL